MHACMHAIYRIPYTLYPIPYTLYPIPYTLYPIPYTLYPIPCTVYRSVLQGLEASLGGFVALPRLLHEGLWWVTNTYS